VSKVQNIGEIITNNSNVDFFCFNKEAQKNYLQIESKIKWQL